MSTASERYRGHPVWETLKLKKEALAAARFDSAESEQWRKDVVEWLTEAAKTRETRVPALYLGILDQVSAELNALPVTTSEFAAHVGVVRMYNPPRIQGLEQALRLLPLPPPKDLAASYILLLDQEVDARNTLLREFRESIRKTEDALTKRQAEVARLNAEIESLRNQVANERAAIETVRAEAASKIATEWTVTLAEWKAKADEAYAGHNEEAVEHVAGLAATAKAGRSLAEHAAGSLSAADWMGRAKRERRAAQWMRAGAVGAFLVAVAVGWFIVSEAIRNEFDLTIGDGILRASIAVVVGAFGGLLLRESSRHFRESDTSEDVALSLQALAPFYADADDDVRKAARVQVGDAVLVKNVLSRFANRDAAKHAADVTSLDLSKVVEESAKALGKASGVERSGS
ncbi:hypothetical protein EDD28_2278 [Salana multivorans]|uniref:Uncharacterized protein n=1 Tax=Salana multivorans TaxID=120377 RepID=A0A3N2DE20_9MICO|nr:hypothetical protein [Salana multivorans]ROR97674.1 hypothetical protein EDD28_2278 [Salana multivorans]